MNNETFKCLVLEGGMMAKAVNPFGNKFTGGAYNSCHTTEYFDFDKANTALPITAPHPAWSIIDVRKVWQYRLSQGSMPFKTVTLKAMNNYKSFDDFVGFCKGDDNVKETRIALEPIANITIKEEKPVPNKGVIARKFERMIDSNINPREQSENTGKTVIGNPEILKLNEAAKLYSERLEVIPTLEAEVYFAFKQGAQWQQSNSQQQVVELLEEEMSQISLDLLNNGSDEMEKTMLIELRVVNDILTKIKQLHNGK